MSAWIWFSGAVLLSIAEVLGAEFVLLMLGGGALVAAGVALIFPGTSTDRSRRSRSGVTS